MSRSESWATVLSLAEEQWGLVTTQQVEATGVAWSTLARQARNGSLERVAHGVYRVRGAGEPEHLELRAAWLQLNPATPAWERVPKQGVVSHRSAAALYGLGHLPADVHEFTLPARKQTRRDDVRLHRGDLPDASWITLHGLPVTRPHRIAADLLADREDPGAVGELIADALRPVYDYPGAVARAIAPYAAAYGLRRGDGRGLLRWLLDLTGDHERQTWLDEAAATNQDRADSKGGVA
jgi:predicted transcriptional regulator of viral defense system